MGTAFAVPMLLNSHAARAAAGHSGLGITGKFTSTGWWSEWFSTSRASQSPSFKKAHITLPYVTLAVYGIRRNIAWNYIWKMHWASLAPGITCCFDAITLLYHLAAVTLHCFENCKLQYISILQSNYNCMTCTGLCPSEGHQGIIIGSNELLMLFNELMQNSYH